MVDEEGKSYVIIVDNLETFPEFSKVLERHVHTVNHLTTLLNSVRNLLRNDGLELWEILTLHKIQN